MTTADTLFSGDPDRAFPEIYGPLIARFKALYLEKTMENVSRRDIWRIALDPAPAQQLFAAVLNSFKFAEIFHETESGKPIHPYLSDEFNSTRNRQNGFVRANEIYLLTKEEFGRAKESLEETPHLFPTINIISDIVAAHLGLIVAEARGLPVFGPEIIAATNHLRNSASDSFLRELLPAMAQAPFKEVDEQGRQTDFTWSLHNVFGMTAFQRLKLRKKDMGGEDVLPSKSDDRIKHCPAAGFIAKIMRTGLSKDETGRYRVCADRSGALPALIASLVIDHMKESATARAMPTTTQITARPG